jgi:hypothetical protein
MSLGWWTYWWAYFHNMHINVLHGCIMNYDPLQKKLIWLFFFSIYAMGVCNSLDFTHVGHKTRKFKLIFVPQVVS